MYNWFIFFYLLLYDKILWLIFWWNTRTNPVLWVMGSFQGGEHTRLVVLWFSLTRKLLHCLFPVITVEAGHVSTSVKRTCLHVGMMCLGIYGWMRVFGLFSTSIKDCKEYFFLSRLIRLLWSACHCGHAPLQSLDTPPYRAGTIFVLLVQYNCTAVLVFLTS